MSETWTQARSRLARLYHTNPDDPDLHAEARRDLRAARLADYVEKVLAEAPPLTDEQKTRIAALLTGNR